MEARTFLWIFVNILVSEIAFFAEIEINFFNLKIKETFKMFFHIY